ncbi:MAG: FemAB family PEP-CTERM system-associated protein [Gammaproteobacteria bacterium]|nr:FemAB family PEP-CTERM system-associated protein [Gammaproteobacteria bacterium]
MTVAAPDKATDSVDQLAVRIVTDSDESEWDQFVQRSPQASFFHRYGWKRVIASAFGHKPFYLAAERNGQICGVLPVFSLQSRLFGNSLISVPFCVYGGPAADDPQSVELLINHAMQIAQDLRVDYLELRNQSPQMPQWPSKDLYVTFRKDISSDHEENLNAVPRKQRAMIRKGLKKDLQGIQDNDIDILYDMYSESVRNLGTPVFSKQYFRLLKQEFADDCEIMIVKKEQEAVAGAMSFYFRDEVLPYYGGGTSQARALCANDFLYWQVMCRAADRGVRVFDYGRSKVDSGSYRFKKHWGFEATPLHYEYGLVRASKMPDLSPNNPKYQLMIRTWKRLPLPVTRLLGPYLSRSLG